jgi:hypothetical protein
MNGSLPMQYTTQDVWHKIEELRRRNAIHRKRGFRINDIGEAMQSNHLIEEVTELQAEILYVVKLAYNGGSGEFDHDKRWAAIVEEASHVLSVYIHLLIKLGIPLGEVCEKAISMYDKHWTTDEREVVAEVPGQTRRGRGQL